MSKWFKFIGFKIIILGMYGGVLASCATTSPMPIKPKNLKAAKYWQMEGKIAVRYDHKAETANINWQQQGQNYNIRLFGPLGLGAVTFQGGPNHIELIDNKGQIHTANSAENLSQQILGYPLPIENLIYWLKGIKTKHYYGWKISYLAYYPNGLPKLMEAHQKDIYIRIFIDKWQFF